MDQKPQEKVKVKIVILKAMQLLKKMEKIPSKDYQDLITSEIGPELLALRKLLCHFMVEDKGIEYIEFCPTERWDEEAVDIPDDEDWDS